MTAGGRRVGAGRPPVLDSLERLAIGADCEKISNDLWRSELQTKLNKLFEDYDEARADAPRGSPDERKRWLASSAFEIYQNDIREERRSIAEIVDGNLPAAGATPMAVYVSAKKPRNVRPVIIARVACEWSQRLGRKINPSTVRLCWIEARAIRDRMLEELDGPQS